MIDGRLTECIKWMPNVRFMADEEYDVVDDPESKQTGGSINRNFVRGLFNKQEVHVGQMVRELTDRVQKEYNVQKATTGILGGNDCTIWAKNLQRMIRQELEMGGIDPSGPKGALLLDVVKDEVPELQVGDTMIHDFNSESGAACGWHGATVIAQDGGSSVALEGHASKNLTAPEFHLRNGILGFVRDNNVAWPKSFCRQEKLGLIGWATMPNLTISWVR